MNVWWFLAGALAAGPLWLLAAAWIARRTWRTARRLAARAKGRQHVSELAQLAGGLAHEIKNPLSTINMNLKLLAEDLARREDEDHRRWLTRLKSVQAEADRLRAILDDFLRFAGKCELALAVVDVRRLIGELADFFTPQAEAAHVLMRTVLPDAPVRCEVDANLIKQALLNLMINAVQASDPGGELMIRLTSDRTLATIEVTDTGRGIAEEELGRIFDVYYSTKKNGTGLGLPTTRRILHEHEGTIRVQSEPGKGTRFAITLPVAGVSGLPRRPG